MLPFSVYRMTMPFRIDLVSPFYSLILTGRVAYGSIGARFGPYGIRSGSRRQRPERGYSLQLGLNPYTHGLGTVCPPVKNGVHGVRR